ncbi:MAG TPA: V4R domain-containing protein [Methanocella sp.]|uniref:V4R domain-containing protein n=1 Tax=Methanocella sp. TaxID=2052833 RepID=UPI002BBC4097|nr:V4R domain-containing protein [Methanocella sp.]HTY90436.1 V4R domain-containing protein [Methanocella sp.]
MKQKKGRDERTAQLFATPGGIRTVDSPVRMKILSMLLEKEMSFDEIVEYSGRAKSTISVHLKSLADDGIVSSHPDPGDARKKIFFIRSSYLGGLSRRKKLETDMEEYISKYALSSGDPFAFFRLMFRTIRVALLNEGIDLDPVLHEAGASVGEALYPRVADRDLSKLLANLAKFWEAQKLGCMEVQSMDPLDVIVYDCFECQDLPYLGRPACAFDSGVLQTIFTRYYNSPAIVKETKCYAMGDDRCEFIIE